MQRISSRSTFFSKRVFPLIWFGFLTIFIIAPLLGKKPEGTLFSRDFHHANIHGDIRLFLDEEASVRSG